MLERGLVFLLGVFAAPIIKPLFRNVGRPLAREVIKLGFVASEKVHRIAQEVREDLEDLTAEASVGLRAKAEDSGDSKSN
jgi:uncharacterized protein DUF5132